jgi:hypothetical protein
MSAFKSPGTVSSLFSGSSEDKSRLDDQERQISELTNETLQLKEEVASL